MKTLSALKKVFYLFLYYFVTFSSFGQNIDVDHYSGRALITIPFVQLNDRTLSHPISLFYNAGGLKVNTSSGIAGLNWILIAGGEVRREVRGIPDDYIKTGDSRSGWLFNSNASSIGGFTFPADNSVLDCDGEQTVYSFIDGKGASADTEPDLFMFSGGGLSGSFIFTNTGDINSVKVIPYQEITVIPHRETSTSPINSFEIITANGVKYTYGSYLESNILKGETEALKSKPFYMRFDYNRFKDPYVNVYTVWKLSSIESPAGEKIAFTYVPKIEPAGGGVTVALTGTSDDTAPVEINQYILSGNQYSYLPGTVTTSHQKVTFHYTGEGESTLLDDVLIEEITPHGSSFVKQLDMQYKVIRSNQGAFADRTFLSAVYAFDACQIYQPYKFQYYDINLDAGINPLPAPGSKNQDIWGYAFNHTAQHAYPKLYVYPGLSGIHRVSLFQKSGQTGEIIIPGANRLSPETSPVGTLTNITYPSGATTSLVYESHEFYNPITGSYSKGAGLRVKYIETFDGVTLANNIRRTFEYKKADGTSSGKLLTMPTFWLVSASEKTANGTVTTYAQMSPLTIAERWRRLIVRTEENLADDYNELSPVAYEYVTEKIGANQGKTVYQFSVPYLFGDTPSGDWNPTFINIARQKVNNVCADAAFNLPSFNQYPFVRQTPIDYHRGLLLNKKVFKEGDDVNPEQETIMNYVDKSIDGAVVKGLRFEYVPVDQTKYYFMYGAYSLVANKLKVLSSVTERFKSKNTNEYLENITSYAYGTDHARTSNITSTNSDGTIITKRFKYVSDFGVPQQTDQNTDTQVKMIGSLFNTFQKGILIETTTSVTRPSSPERTVDGTLLIFDDFNKTPSNPPLILPKETFTLRTSGIENFSLSSFSGAGTTRTFVRNNAYKRAATSDYGALGDLVYIENERRQLSSFHTDAKSGAIVANIANAKPDEVIHSNFDQDTNYDFDFVGFDSQDLFAQGKASEHALTAWSTVTSPTHYLKKQISRKANVKYKFTCWFKTMVTGATHSFSVVVKDLSGTILLTQSMPINAPNASEWYYQEKSIDLSTLAAASINVELHYTGTGTTRGAAIVDDVSLFPEDALVERHAYSTAFGETSVTAPDGRLTEIERLPSGRVKYTRDHDGNILQRTFANDYVPLGQEIAPIFIDTPGDIIYENEATVFNAFTGCNSYSTMKWKVKLKSDPNPGTFVNGGEFYSYTFPSAGVYVVSLQVNLDGYGLKETSREVTVTLKPLTVQLCVQEGAVTIDLCQAPNAQETLVCDNNPGTTNYLYTTFVASASGCQSGTYTYEWYIRDYRTEDGEWVHVASGTTYTMTNLYSYAVKCTASSNCQKTGESNAQFVYVYKSNSSCPGPLAE